MSQEIIAYVLFKKAIAKMLKDGEFDKSYKHKKRVRDIKEALLVAQEKFEGGIEGVPMPVLMAVVDDAEILQTAIYYMGGIEYNGGTHD